MCYWSLTRIKDKHKHHYYFDWETKLIVGCMLMGYLFRLVEFLSSVTIWYVHVLISACITWLCHYPISRNGLDSAYKWSSNSFIYIYKIYNGFWSFVNVNLYIKLLLFLFHNKKYIFKKSWLSKVIKILVAINKK